MHPAAGLGVPSGAVSGAGGAAGEIRALTGLRGVAVGLVMLYHARPASELVPVEQVFRHGYLTVDLFFVLSGFVMALSHPEIAGRAAGGAACLRFLGRRLARIYPLYLLSTVLSLALFAVLHLRGFEDQLWHRPLLGAEVANVLMVQSWGLAGSFNGAAWSISTEWMAYLLFPVLCLAALRSRAGVRVAFAVAVVGGLVALSSWPDFPAWRDADPRLGPLDRTSHHSAACLLRCVLEFCLGLYGHAAYARVRPVLDRHGGAVAVAALAGVACLLPLPGTDWAVVLLYVPLVVGACARGPVGHVLGWGPVHRLGRYSYAFYMLHVLVLGGWGAIAAGVRRAGLGEGFAAVFLACFGVTVILAALTHRYVERPSSAALRRLLAGEASRKSKHVLS